MVRVELPFAIKISVMFTLARPDIFPIGDLGIRNGMKKLFNKSEMINEQMVEISKNWKPYRTVASWYIWKVLDENWNEGFDLLKS